MATNIRPITRDADSMPQFRLWFGPMAGAFAFAMNGWLNWIISARACYIGHGYLGSLTPTDVRYILGGITAVLFALALTGAITSYKRWKQITHHADVTHGEGKQASEYIPLVGVFVSSILTFAIIWISIPLMLIPVCERAH